MDAAMRPPLLFEFDPTRDEHAYFLGLLATDGCITKASRNRGRVTFELSAVDAAVLRSLVQIMPYSGSLSGRVRTTNFRKSHESAILTFHDLRLRQRLMQYGYAAGKKSGTVGPPLCAYNESGFWRGVLDGDGSMGITAGDHAFVSVVTASDPLRNSYVDYVTKITGARPNPKRNARDYIYNIVLFDETAQCLVRHLYRDDLIAIPRKVAGATLVAGWRRPPGRARISFERRRWTPDEDRCVLSELPQKMIATELGRTEHSINLRRWRLRASLGDAALANDHSSM